MPPRPQPQTLQSGHIPAPIGGMNTIAAGALMPPLDAVWLYNMISAEQGLRARTGYKEWVTNIPLTGNTAGQSMRTLIPFAGSTPSGDRLFALGDDGIYDVTVSQDNSGTFGVTYSEYPYNEGNTTNGYGMGRVVVTSAGHFLLVCEEGNGLGVYSEASGLWNFPPAGAGATEINGVDPLNLVFAHAFKARVWYVERDSARAWYTAAGSIYGTVTRFDFGREFKSGGSLVGLWSWTYDGGNGVDDLLVAISSTGDLAIYAGTDPSDATKWGLRGVWNVGPVPAGRNIATSHGGELLVLSSLGVVSLSKLVAGGSLKDSLYATEKVSNLFNLLMSSYRTVRGWSIHVHPEDNVLLVTVPSAADTATTQLAMSFGTKAWSQYRDLPILSACVWDGTLFFGTADGRVCVNEGYVDDVLLTDSDSWSPVAWSVLTAFQGLQNGRNKQVQLIEPIVLSQQVDPTVEATALYDFDLTEPAPPSVLASNNEGAWGSSTWDASVWGGDYTASLAMQGGEGVGKYVAIAARGVAKSRTTLVGFDVHFTQGGIL
jgi:hypothetical protein